MWLMKYLCETNFDKFVRFNNCTAINKIHSSLLRMGILYSSSTKWIMYKMKTTLFLLLAVLVLVLPALTVVMPRAYATGPYDGGYNTAKFDFLHHKSYNDSCHTDCTLYKLGYSEGWNTVNGWLGNR